MADKESEDEDDQDENNNEKNNTHQNDLSDLDKEEIFMKSCYEFYEYVKFKFFIKIKDINTICERGIIEDSNPIRTSCFNTKGGNITH